MRNYEIREGKGLNPKNMGDTSGTAKRYFVWDADNDVQMHGFTPKACRDGGFKTKKAASEFIAILTGQQTRIANTGPMTKRSATWTA